MNKTITAIAAAGVFTLATVSVPSEAQAWCRGCGVGFGILGGLAAGAIIGSAVANSAYPAYAVQPGYYAYPAYAVPAPVGCESGYWARRPLMDQYGNVVGYSRPRFFCP
jgi:hypothetical protein